MSRFKVEGPWNTRISGQNYGRYLIQYADARDTKTNTLYMAGAYRVIDETTGKPAVRGKGGTVPFYGEVAWSDAERLASDLFWKVVLA